MLTHSPGLHSFSGKRIPVPTPSSCHSKPSIACAAAWGSKSQQGWHWPCSTHAADEPETEIVYVTDTAEADEVIEEPDAADVTQQQYQPGALEDALTPPAIASAAADAGDQAPQAQQAVPEALAAAGSATQQEHHQQPQQQHTPAAAAAASCQAVSPRPAFASSSLAAPVAGGYWSTSAGGWVVALSLLVAVRQGREHADAARLDVRALQARQQESRVQGRELKEKRAQYLQQQQLLKEEAATKRLAEQARDAEKARREAAAKAAEYEMTAREELDRFKAKRAAAKKAFEESQGKLEEELAARTAREIALREEAEAKKTMEEAQRRAAAAAEAARVAAEAAAAAEAAGRAAREAAAARAALKQQLRDSSYCYRLHLHGTAVAAPVTAGGRQPQLSVTLSIRPQAGSSSGAAAPPVAQVNRVYDSPDAATDGAAALAVQAAQQVYTHYLPAVMEGVVDLEGLSLTQQGAGSSQQQQQQQEGPGGKGVRLSEADNMLWRLLLLARLETAGRQAVGQVAPLAASGELQQDLQAQVAYSALPQSDPNSLQQRLQQCADLAAQQQLPAATRALDDIIEWQLEDFLGADLSSMSSNSNSNSLAGLMQQVLGSGAAACCAASPYLVPACVYAVLLDVFDPATQAINRRTASRRAAAVSALTSAATAAGAAADSPAPSPDDSRPSSPDATAADDEDMFDSVDDPDSSSSSSSSLPAALARRSIVGDQDPPLQRLVKFQLEQLEKAAPADELAPVAGCLRLLLGRRHPVVAALQLLAERNMSPGARQARALRQQQKQLARATELLKDSAVAGPGGLNPQGARQRQQLVPAPERIWALRNVASSMLRSTASSGGGSSSSSTPSAEEAVSMLKQASDLAAEHYGQINPGRLSVLLDYIGALLVVPGHQAEAKAAIEAVCSIVAAVGERYRQQKDLLSLVLLYESTQAELDVPEVVGRECVGMTRLQRQAADAFGVLETAQANMVMSRRKLAPRSPRTALRQLARDCTEQLGGSVAVKKRDTRLDQWIKGLPLAPLR